MVDKYKAKYIPQTLGKQREAVKALAIANFTAYANEWELKAAATRDYLNEQGIAVNLYFLYFGFSNQLFHVWKHFAGQAAAEEAQTLVLQYTGWGGVPQVLDGIRVQVYNIGAPIGP